MGLFNFVRSKGYRNFMSKLYGWGASVVIIGALFKINHYPGADIMLIIGLGTESIIFFFSAFEPPHVEPDWSLVYPQLAGIYHEGEKTPATGDTLTQELDDMLEKAKIGPELIESLGNGLRNLSDTTTQLSNVSNASLANDQYVNTLKQATESVSGLTESYSKTAASLDQSAQITQEQVEKMQAVSENAGSLSEVYAKVADSLNQELSLSHDLISSMGTISESSNTFVEKYQETADVLSRTTESLQNTVASGESYNEQMLRVSSNLSALNAIYELNLQNANQQQEQNSQFTEVLQGLIQNLNESSANSAQYKENLAALNQAIEQQVSATTSQLDASGHMQEAMSQFMSNLNESVERTGRFKEEVNTLAENIAALNQVYGNMLSAMNVNINK